MRHEASAQTSLGPGALDDPATGAVCEVGRIYAGQYLVRGLLGKGGMAEVYLVEHQILKAELALKVLRPSYRMRTDIVQRFRDESRALWELSHPSFVKVHHAGEDSEIGPYMSMEVLRGKTLAQLLAIKGRLTIEEALPIVIEAAEAAQVMHDLGILHRDLKPDNIFITTRDTQGGRRMVKLLDLGIAKIAKYGGPATTGNRTVGTGKYMSPEHIRSEPLGPTTDLYALAHIVYEMVSGTHAFGAHHPNPTHLDWAMWHLNATPEPLVDRLPGAPRDLSDALLQGMSKQSAHRFQSMSAFASALDDVLSRAIAHSGRGGTVQMSMPTAQNDDTLEAVLSSASPDGQWAIFDYRKPNATETVEIATTKDPISRGMAIRASGDQPRSAPTVAVPLVDPRRQSYGSYGTMRMTPVPSSAHPKTIASSFDSAALFQSQLPSNPAPGLTPSQPRRQPLAPTPPMGIEAHPGLPAPAKPDHAPGFALKLWHLAILLAFTALGSVLLVLLAR